MVAYKGYNVILPKKYYKNAENKLLVVNYENTLKEIDESLRQENAESILKKIGVADVYNDGNSKSITVRLLFGDDERTLTHEEVQKVVDDIIEKLKNRGINLKA